MLFFLVCNVLIFDFKVVILFFDDCVDDFVLINLFCKEIIVDN